MIRDELRRLVFTVAELGMSVYLVTPFQGLGGVAPGRSSDIGVRDGALTGSEGDRCRE
jgi:hypothetical protein